MIRDQDRWAASGTARRPPIEVVGPNRVNWECGPTVGLPMEGSDVTFTGSDNHVYILIDIHSSACRTDHGAPIASCR